MTREQQLEHALRALLKEIREVPEAWSMLNINIINAAHAVLDPEAFPQAPIEGTPIKIAPELVQSRTWTMPISPSDDPCLLYGADRWLDDPGLWLHSPDPGYLGNVVPLGVICRDDQWCVVLRTYSPFWVRPIPSPPCGYDLEICYRPGAGRPDDYKRNTPVVRYLHCQTVHQEYTADEQYFLYAAFQSFQIVS